ncbi:hypothetical protein [Flindersiella endophytica]
MAGLLDSFVGRLAIVAGVQVVTVLLGVLISFARDPRFFPPAVARPTPDPSAAHFPLPQGLHPITPVTLIVGAILHFAFVMTGLHHVGILWPQLGASVTSATIAAVQMLLITQSRPVNRDVLPGSMTIFCAVLALIFGCWVLILSFDPSFHD